MKITYVFLNQQTGKLTHQEAANEYVARQINPTISMEDVLYQTILEATSYTRIVTYKINGFWNEVESIQQINK